MRAFHTAAMAVAMAALVAQTSSAQTPPPAPHKIVLPKPIAVKPPPMPKPVPIAPLQPLPITMPQPQAKVQPAPAPVQTAQTPKPKPVLTAPQPAIIELRAETMSSIGQVLAPYAKGKSANPSVVRALQILRQQQLAGPPPHVPPASGLAAGLAKAMQVESKTAQLLPQLAVLNDSFAAAPDAQKKAALGLLRAAGTPKPTDAALQKMLDDAKAVHAQASQPSQHGKLAAGKSTIDIDSSPNAGMAQISVISNGPDGKPERVTFEGAQKTVPADEDLQPQFEPDAPHVVTSAEAADMRNKANGTWTDQEGHEWDISGAGENIVFTEILSDGHPVAYPGHWVLGLPYASHLVNDVLDMDDTLPGDVKQDLADSWHPPFAVRLEYDPVKDEFHGVWISGEVTYGGMYHNIKVVNDPTWDKPLVLVRSLKPAYHIASVKVDYSPWERAMQQKSSEERVTKAELDDREAELKSAEKLYEDKIDAAKAEQKKLLDARTASQKADDAAANAALDPSKETPEYKQHEADLARTNQRLADVSGVIDRTLAMGGTVPNVTLDRRDALQKKSDDQSAALQKLGESLGLAAKRDALFKGAEDAADKRRHEEVNYVAAMAGVEAAHKGQQDSIDLYETAYRAHEDAAAAWHVLEAKGKPLITYVAVTNGGGQTYYYAQYWDPKEALDFFDSEIPALEKAMLGAADYRIESRGTLLSTQQQATIDLDRLESGIMKSAYAQSAVEAGYYFWDVVSKAREGGPLGALTEAVKKLVEGLVLGMPSFYEPQLAVQLKPVKPTGTVSDLWNLASDTATKRTKKTMGWLAVDYRVKQYMADHSFEKFLSYTGKAVVRQPGRTPIVLDAENITNARAFYEKFKTAYAAQQKAWGDLTFSAFSKTATSGIASKAKAVLTSKPVEKMAYGLAKDLSKQWLKQLLGEKLEGGPLYDSIFSEYKAQAASAQFLAASAAYWQAVDEYKMRLAERAAILKDYDPNTQLKATVNREFASGQTVRIEFTDRDGHIMATGNRKYKVLLGGREAHFAGGPYLQFDVAARDLKDDGHGGVELSITVSD